MPLKRTCKDVARLVLQAPDRPLTLAERLSLRLHWLACTNCSRFRDQARTMNQALTRWKAYRDE